MALGDELLTALENKELGEAGKILDKISALPEKERKKLLNDTYTSEGSSPLTLLVSSAESIDSNAGEYKIFDRLVKMGADPNKYDKNGATPVHIAIALQIQSNSSTLDTLLKRDDIDLNRKESGVHPPLTFALTYGEKGTSVATQLARLGAGKELLEQEDQSKKSSFVRDYLLPTNGTAFQYLEKDSLEKNFNVKKIENFIGKALNTDFRHLGNKLEKPQDLKNIIQDPANFLKKPLDDQKGVLDAIFGKNHNINIVDFNKLLKERVDFMNGLDKERKKAEELSEIVMLGHRLGMSGKFDYKVGKNKNDSLEGSYEGSSVYRTAPAVNQKVNEYNTKVQEGNFSDTEKKAFQIVTESFNENTKSLQNDNYKGQAKRYLEDKPIIIPCRFPGHMASAVLYKDKLYISNKGFGTLVPSIQCYKINTDKLPKNEKDLAEYIETLSTKERTGVGLNNGNLALQEIKDLEPELVYQHRLKGQKQGNCSYTNTKRAADAVMMALIDEAKIDAKNGKENEFKDLDHRKMYKGFANYDKEKALKDYVELCKTSENENKWDPLISYLQNKTDPFNQRTVATSKYILKELKSNGWTDEKIAEKLPLLKSTVSFKEANSLAQYAQEGPPSKGLRFLQSAIFQKEDKAENLKRAILYMIPGGSAYVHSEGLKAAGMDPEHLPPTRMQAFYKLFTPKVKEKSEGASFRGPAGAEISPVTPTPLASTAAGPSPVSPSPAAPMPAAPTPAAPMPAAPMPAAPTPAISMPAALTTATPTPAALTPATPMPAKPNNEVNNDLMIIRDKVNEIKPGRWIIKYSPDLAIVSPAMSQTEAKMLQAEFASKIGGEVRESQSQPGQFRVVFDKDITLQKIRKFEVAGESAEKTQQLTSEKSDTHNKQPQDENRSKSVTFLQGQAQKEGGAFFKQFQKENSMSENIEMSEKIGITPKKP